MSPLLLLLLPPATMCLSWTRSRSQLRFVGSNILWQWQSTRAAQQHFVVAGVKFMLISIMSNMLYFLYPVDRHEEVYT